MNIYVGNISYSVTEDELIRAFGAYGSVASCKIIIDRETGRSKGFGFVEMDEDDEGRAAIEALNEALFNGRPLRVNEARPRSEGGAGGGAGRFRSARPPRRDSYGSYDRDF